MAFMTLERKFFLKNTKILICFVIFFDLIDNQFH